MTADREESEVKGYMNGDACGSGDSVALRRRPSRPQDARTVALRLTVGFRANKYPYSTVSMNADSRGWRLNEKGENVAQNESVCHKKRAFASKRPVCHQNDPFATKPGSFP